MLFGTLDESGEDQPNNPKLVVNRALLMGEQLTLLHPAVVSIGSAEDKSVIYRREIEFADDPDGKTMLLAVGSVVTLMLAEP